MNDMRTAVEATPAVGSSRPTSDEQDTATAASHSRRDTSCWRVLVVRNGTRSHPIVVAFDEAGARRKAKTVMSADEVLGVRRLHGLIEGHPTYPTSDEHTNVVSRSLVERVLA